MQTARARKLAWKSIDRFDRSHYKFDENQPLVSFIDQKTPGNGLTILFGGGKGYLGRLLSNGRRIFLNIDLEPTSEYYVNSVTRDLEEPLSAGYVRALRNGSAPVTVITPLSLEYMELKPAADNIRRILEPGEKFIWICHHQQSSVVFGFRKYADITTLILSLLQKLPTEDKADLAEEAADRLDVIWERLGGAIIFRQEFVDMLIGRPDRINMFLNDDPVQGAYLMPHALSCAGISKDNIAQILRIMAEFYGKDTALAEKLLERTYRTPRDMARALGEGFCLEDESRFFTGIGLSTDALVGIFTRVK